MRRYHTIIATLILIILFIPYQKTESQTFEYREVQRIGRGRINSISWNPDQTILAVGSEQGIWLYNEQLEDIQQLDEKVSPISQLQWIADSRQIIALTRKNTVELWDVPTAKLIRESDFASKHVYAMYLSPDSSRFALISNQIGQFSIQVLAVDSMNILLEYDNSSSRIVDLAWRGDNSQISLVTQDGIYILDIDTAELLPTPYVVDNRSFVSWGEENDYIAIAETLENKHRIIVWDPFNNNVEILAETTDYISVIAWSPDNSLLAYTTPNEIKVLDIKLQTVVTFIDMQDTIVTDIGWKDELNLVGILFDGSSLKIWQLSDGTEISQLEKHSLGVNQLDWSVNNYIAVNSGDTSTVKVYDAANGEIVYKFISPIYQPIVDMDWSYDSQYLAISYFTNSIQVWSMSDSSFKIFQYPESENIGWVFLDWHPGEYHLATMNGRSDARTLVIWDTVTGEALHTQSAASVLRATWLDWNSSGDLLSIASGDGSIEIWDMTNQQKILDGFSDTRIIWHPFENKIAGSTCNPISGECTIYLSDTERQSRRLEMPLSIGRPLAMAWHPLGNLIAIAWWEEVIIWDVDINEVVGIIHSETGGIFTSLAWNSNGSLLASGNADGAIRIWEINYLKKVSSWEKPETRYNPS